METSHKLSYRIFAHWTTFCYQNAIWVILIALLATALSIVYTSRNLGVYTDTTDMLSEDIPFRANHERYKAAFPQYKDTMLLVLDAPTPEQAHTAAKRLSAQLQNDDKHFHNVYYASGNSFFEKNGLLYKSISELGHITDRLAAAQPLVARIADDPTFYTFIAVLTEAIDALRTGQKLELEPILNGVSTTMNARLSGTPRALSWETLFSGDAQKDTYQALILTQPKMDFTQLFAAEQPIIAAQTAARLIGITHNSPEQLRITGEVALSYDELNSAMRGAQSAGLISLAMVAIVLFFALRAIGSVLTVLLSLILGLLLTAAFATVAVGHLNLISIAFAVLYIGLGVDYAIHFLLRHQELQQPNVPTVNTIYTTGGDIGRALMICAITTAIGFYAFMPTDYRGVAELGLISGTGMLISLVVTLTLVPALQRYLPVSHKPTVKTASFDQLLASPPQWSHKYIYIVTAVILLASIIVLPGARFDYNLLNMNDPQAESVKTFQELLANAEDSPWHLIALAKDRQEIENITQRLNELPEVNKIVTLFDLVPKNQEEKSFFIEEMALTLGPIALSKPSAEINNQALGQQQLALETLIKALNQFTIEQPNHSVSISARTLSASLSTLLTRLIASEQKPNGHDAHLFHTVGDDLLHLLPDSLERMQIAFEAQPFTLQALPASLLAHWRNQNNTYRMIVYPKENINDNDALRHFVRAVQQIAPHVTGAPVISLEAGEAVVDAFIQAFSLALLGVILALLILLRNVMDTLFVLAPLLLAAIFTGACTILLDIPFNFANIIALPLLLGIGIDCSVHMVHRNRNTETTTHKSLLHTSTARAIFYSALTTLAGFGSLAFSPHHGTATMGILLAIGVLLTLLCVLFILPVLLQSSSRSKDSQSGN